MEEIKSNLVKSVEEQTCADAARQSTRSDNRSYYDIDEGFFGNSANTTAT